MLAFSKHFRIKDKISIYRSKSKKETLQIFVMILLGLTISLNDVNKRH